MTESDIEKIRAELKEARRYARWLLHQGSEGPAVDVLVEKHGPLPEWLAARWTEW